MKNLLLTILLFSTSFGIANAQLLYDDFEGNRIADYFYRDGQFSTVPNPNTTGINPSANCGQYIRNGAAQYDIMEIGSPGFFDDVTPYITGERILRMKVYSSRRGVPVQISFEDTNQTTPTNYPAGRIAIFKDTTTLVNQWEELVFRLDSRPDMNASPFGMNVMLLAFNINSNNASTYYFDDLQGPEYTPGGPVIGEFLMEDFEGNRTYDYGFRDGTLTQSILNPAPNAVNNSSLVGRYTRNANARYDVLICNLDGNAVGIDQYVTGRKKFTMKVYSTNPAGTIVDLTVQDGRRALPTNWPTGRHSVWRATTRRSGEWEVLEFGLHELPDRNQRDTTLNNFIIQFDPVSNTGNTYYFDDVKGFTTNGLGLQTQYEYLWDNFRDTRRVRYTLVNGTLGTGANNPGPSNVNGYPTVGSYLRSNNQYDVIIATWPSPLQDLPAYQNNSKRFSMQVFSPGPGNIIGFTLQDSTLAFGDNYPRGRYAEFSGVTTKTNEWETITLRRSAIPDPSVTPGEVNSLAILFNSGSFDATQYYIDNINGPIFDSPIPNSVAKNNTNQGLVCFPVPAADFVNVKFDLKEGDKASIEIVDLNGKVVASRNVNYTNSDIHQANINTSQLSSGLYICKLTTGIGTSTCKIQVK